MSTKLQKILEYRYEIAVLFVLYSSKILLVKTRTLKIML